MLSHAEDHVYLLYNRHNLYIVAELKKLLQSVACG